MCLNTIAQRFHNECSLTFGDVGPCRLVVRRKDQNLVDATGSSAGKDGATVLNNEGRVTLKSGIEVGNNAHEPVALWAVGFEGWGSVFFVAWTKGAGPYRVVITALSAKFKGFGSLCTGFRDHYPATRKWVKPQFGHR